MAPRSLVVPAARVYNGWHNLARRRERHDYSQVFRQVSPSAKRGLIKPKLGQAAKGMSRIPLEFGRGPTAGV